jgi:hypothetical protein
MKNVNTSYRHEVVLFINGKQVTQGLIKSNVLM